jgi:hypothetical protein
MTLVRDRSTLNLLYSQTVSDVEKGWIITDEETKEKLATLQSRGAKREVKEIKYCFGIDNYHHVLS